MMRLARIIAACVPLMAGLAAVAGNASAQEAQPAPVASAQRCGGLFCDAYFGMNPNAKPGATSLPCHDFLCGAFGGRTSDEPVQQAAAAPETVSATPAPKKKKHVAKAGTRQASTKQAAAKDTMPAPVKAAETATQ